MSHLHPSRIGCAHLGPFEIAPGLLNRSFSRHDLGAGTGELRLAQRQVARLRHRCRGRCQSLSACLARACSLINAMRASSRFDFD